MTTPDTRPPRFPLAAADRCVMCGLCLPHCPTYRLHQNEAESPRGRVALMAAEARGLLRPGGADAHLDSCLGCRACERACPSKVPYGQLLDAHRAVRAAARPHWRGMLARIGRDGLLARPRNARLAAALLRLAQRSGLLRLAPLLGMRRAAELLPALQRSPKHADRYPAIGHTRGAVALFRGCVGDLVGSGGNRAAIALLTRFGYQVEIPPGQTCCGALHLHAGDRAGAERLARVNRDRFDRLPVDAVLGTASACILTLSEYPALLDDQALTSRPLLEVSQFLAEQPWPPALQLRPLHATVAVHQPCSQVHGLASQHSTLKLLGRIPGIALRPLPTRAQCCGAAGDYMLRQPHTADRLADEILATLADQPIRLLVSANIGCAIHLQAAARRRAIDLEVVHPLTLLERQLER